VAAQRPSTRIGALALALGCLLSAPARASGEVGPCPTSELELAQACALASAVVVGFAAPLAQVTATGTDGHWSATPDAPSFFQSNLTRLLTVRVLEEGTDASLPALAGNNLSTDSTSGAAYSIFETTTWLPDATSGRYRWHEVVVSVAYRVGHPEGARFVVDTQVSDFVCDVVGDRPSIQRDCRSGTISRAYGSRETQQAEFGADGVCVTQPSECRTDVVRNDGHGVMQTVASSAGCAGTWSFRGSITRGRVTGTTSWLERAHPRVDRALASTRQEHAWSVRSRQSSR
jgi:hypothetical protein